MIRGIGETSAADSTTGKGGWGGGRAVKSRGRRLRCRGSWFGRGGAARGGEGRGASTPCVPGSRALGLRRERRTPSRGCGNCPAPCVAALGAQRMEAGRPLQCGSHLIQGRAPLGAFVLGVFTATAVEGRPGRTAGRFVRPGVCGSPGGRPWLSPACSAPSRDWFPGRVGRCSRAA